HGLFCRPSWHYIPAQFPSHFLRKIPAMLLIRTEHFDLFKIEKAAQILEMRTRLPTTAEQPENPRLRRSQIFRTDGAQRSNAHFLNHAIGHDRDRLNALDVEQDNEPAVSVAGSDGQDPPALDACGERMAGHIGSNSERPDAGAGAAPF